jgi:hypothetical protein
MNKLAVCYRPMVIFCQKPRSAEGIAGAIEEDFIVFFLFLGVSDNKAFLKFFYVHF